MTKRATARIAAVAAKDAAEGARNAAREVATDTKNLAADAGNEVDERTVVGLKEASAKAVSMTADTQNSHRLRGLSSFSQQNLKAFARSSEIIAKALESIGGEVAAFTKKSFEDRVVAAQDISSAKTPAELVGNQTSFAQHAFQDWAQQAIRISAIYTSAAKDLAAPLGERMSAATAETKSIAR